MQEDCEVRRVLVVDDEKVIADSLAAILRTQGYMARAAYSAAGAMSAARDILPHTLISDVLMPEINGIELAAYFSVYHPDCTVVLMSADSAAPGLLDTALRQGHTAQTKPVAPSQVLELLAGFAPVA